MGEAILRKNPNGNNAELVSHEIQMDPWRRYARYGCDNVPFVASDSACMGHARTYFDSALSIHLL